jgi:hypothetical protein
LSDEAKIEKDSRPREEVGKCVSFIAEVYSLENAELLVN